MSLYDKYWKNESLPEKYKLVLDEIGSQKIVLDLGCHDGLFSEYLLKNNNYVIGVDSNKVALLSAKNKCSETHLIDLNKPQRLSKIFEVQSFDYILAMDVLEHLINPQDVLIELKKLLKHNGELFVTLPNVAFWGVRKKLILGEFDYQEVGILDKTHLRFFTCHTGFFLIENSGYLVFQRIPLSYMIPLVGRLGLRKSRLLGAIIHKFERYLALKYPNFYAMQILYRARIIVGE